jgi:hypothetical protein
MLVNGSGECALGRGNAACLPWVNLGCHTERAGNSFEACLGNMVIVGAIVIEDVQRDSGILRQRLEKLAHQIGIEGADLG